VRVKLRETTFVTK